MTNTTKRVLKPTETGPRKTWLILISDHELFRDGLAQILRTDHGFYVAGGFGTCTSGPEAPGGELNIALVDSNIGWNQIRHYLQSAGQNGYPAKIVILTGGMSSEECVLALKSGAAGIFFKHNPSELLARVIRRIQRGEVWVDKRAIRIMALPEVQRRQEESLVCLTQRQQIVLKGIVDGLTNKEIGSKLGSTESSVKATLQSLFHKTQVRTRSQLIRIALEIPGFASAWSLPPPKRIGRHGVHCCCHTSAGESRVSAHRSSSADVTFSMDSPAGLLSGDSQAQATPHAMNNFG